MRRFWLSTGILLGLVGLCIWSLLLLHAQCRDFRELVTLTESAYTQNDTARTLECCEALLADWEHFHDITGMFVDGGKLDTIYAHLIRLRPLLAARDPEAAAELQSLQLLIYGLYEEELPVFWHIL